MWRAGKRATSGSNPGVGAGQRTSTRWVTPPTVTRYMPDDAGRLRLPSAPARPALSRRPSGNTTVTSISGARLTAIMPSQPFTSGRSTAAAPAAVGATSILTLADRVKGASSPSPKRRRGAAVYYPPMSLCTDNAAMICARARGMIAEGAAAAKLDLNAVSYLKL